MMIRYDERPGQVAGDEYERDATYSFVVRIWFEEGVEEFGRAACRGHITHVPSGERRYVKSIDDIAAFIESYLAETGLDFGKRCQVRRWLKWWKPHWKRRR